MPFSLEWIQEGDPQAWRPPKVNRESILWPPQVMKLFFSPKRKQSYFSYYLLVAKKYSSIYSSAALGSSVSIYLAPHSLQKRVTTAEESPAFPIQNTFFLFVPPLLSYQHLFHTCTPLLNPFIIQVACLSYHDLWFHWYTLFLINSSLFILSIWLNYFNVYIFYPFYLSTIHPTCTSFHHLSCMLWLLSSSNLGTPHSPMK